MTTTRPAPFGGCTGTEKQVARSMPDFMNTPATSSGSRVAPLALALAGAVTAVCSAAGISTSATSSITTSLSRNESNLFGGLERFDTSSYQIASPSSITWYM